MSTGALPICSTGLRRPRRTWVCLQELKADSEFPQAAIENAGYGAAWRGQKKWNGVAILGRGCEPVVMRTELPGDPADVQPRYIEAAVRGVIVTSLTRPNGNPQPGPKFAYKLAWMERLARHAAELYAAGVPVVLAGDYNVMPTDRDIYPTGSYAKDVLLQPGKPRAVPAHPRTRLGRRRPGAASGRADAYVLSLQTEPLAAGCRPSHRSPAVEQTCLRTHRRCRGGREVRAQQGASDHAPAWVMLRDQTKPPGRRPVAAKDTRSRGRWPRSQGRPLWAPRTRRGDDVRTAATRLPCALSSAARMISGCPS
jgi:exodeoxyribonuclease-3